MPDLPMLLLLAAVLLAPCVMADLHCFDPQKAFFLSYDALGKRDTMPDIFKEINTKVPKFNASYDDGKGAVYGIANLVPQMYYNQHHQKQSYMDAFKVNVTLGDIYLAEHFNYTIHKGSQSVKGSAMARVLLDQTGYFVKSLRIIDGALNWDLVENSELRATYLISIQRSEPVLTHDDKTNLQLMLNDQAPNSKLKSQVLSAFNSQYKQLIAVHLNKENLIGNSTIEYSFKAIGKTITLPYTNVIKNFTLSDQASLMKGLTAFFFFEPNVGTPVYPCTGDHIKINMTINGGVQEFYSFSSMKQGLLSALKQGLFQVKVDKKWDVPFFQFYVGDLANGIPYADKFNPSDPIDADCNWDRDASNLKLVALAEHEIQATVGIKCTVNYNSKPVLEVTFDAGFVTEVAAEEEELKFIVKEANVFGTSFKAVDPNFEVGNKEYARAAVAYVVHGINRSIVIGSGWKTSKRRFPSTSMQTQYMVVFDAAQMS